MLVTVTQKTLFGAVVLVGGLLWSAAIWRTDGEVDAISPALNREAAPPANAPVVPERAEIRTAEPPPAAEPLIEPESPAAPSAKMQPQPELQNEPEPVASAVPVRMGPVEELQQQYANESRPSVARDLESLVDAVFKGPGVPVGMLRSVLCRETICRIQLGWSEALNTGYMSAYTYLLRDFGDKISVDPATHVEPNGVHQLELYVKQRTAVLTP